MYRRVFGMWLLALLNTSCYSWAATPVPAPSSQSSISGPLRVRLSNGDIAQFHQATVVGDSIVETRCGTSVAAGGRSICQRTERPAIALASVVGLERREARAEVRAILVTSLVIGGLVLIVAGIRDFQRCGLYGCE